VRGIEGLVTLLVGLSACDDVFGLERHDRVIDAPHPIDTVDGTVLANHDEDSDGKDDNIDVCPNVADSEQADSDGDGVGDDCDPFPGQGGDRRYYFSTLQGFADWNVVVGDWTQAVDAVRVTERSGNQLAVLNRPPVDNPTVIAVIEQPTSSASGVDYGVMLVTQLDDAFPPGVACYIYSTEGSLYIYDNRGVQGISQKNPLSPELPVTVSLEGATSKTGPERLPRCAGRAATGRTVESVEPVPGVTSAIPALYTFDGAATFKSVLVLTR
jgi:hypothetical protein